jgi:small subunit ribosomal protein S18
MADQNDNVNNRAPEQAGPPQEGAPRPADGTAGPRAPGGQSAPGAPSGPRPYGDRPSGPGGPRPGGQGGYRPGGQGGGYRPGGQGGPRSGPGGRPGGGRPRGRDRYIPRRKVCAFCVDKVQDIDYKDVARLRRYLSERAKIEPRRKTGTCARHQRALSVALKRARHMALLPYVGPHSR